MKQISETKRQYDGKEIAEAVMVYDELRKIGAVDKGRLDAQKIAASYRNEGHGVDMDFGWPLKVTVIDLPPEEAVIT
jgi:hypothetical protein